MDYLVKENLKKRSDLLQKWQRFLLERNTDAIADLLIGFFEAKRRYGRDIERGEDIFIDGTMIADKITNHKNAWPIFLNLLFHKHLHYS